MNVPLPQIHPHPAALLGDHAGEGLVRLFGRHFISMVVAFRDKHGVIHKSVYSSFVASHDGEWSLLTAGHNLAQLVANAKVAQLVAWDLADAFAEGPHQGTTPSTFLPSDWKFLYSDFESSGVDIAAVTIPPLIVRSLKANNVTPLELADDLIRLSHIPCRHLFLVGCARETTLFVGTRLKQLLYCIPVTPLSAQGASELLRGEAPRVIGEIRGDGWSSAGITTIEGTSGGPVFGVWISEDGASFDYAAVGIQSGWDPVAKQIAAWPLGSLSARLAEVKRQKLASSA